MSKAKDFKDSMSNDEKLIFNQATKIQRLENKIEEIKKNRQISFKLIEKTFLNDFLTWLRKNHGGLVLRKNERYINDYLNQ